MRFVLSASDLKDRLSGAGHAFPKRTDGITGATDVWPEPHLIVTVGLYLDPTLKPEYRERYFVCLLESQDNPAPVLQYDPAFALAESFCAVVEQSPPRSGFMDGPFRWLLQRLQRFRQLLLWPANRGNESVSLKIDPLRLSKELPRLAVWLRATNMASVEVGAIILNLTEAGDCEVLWKIADAVSDSCKDWYVSDPECKEVYCLHRHDKIVASVPNQMEREAMLQELANRSDLIEDCSRYHSEMEDESR